MAELGLVRAVGLERVAGTGWVKAMAAVWVTAKAMGMAMEPDRDQTISAQMWRSSHWFCRVASNEQ